MKDKIAIVVQRYGSEINGGAELHARLLAEKLNLSYEVEIITTCAIEYESWNNYYKEGSEIINGITVRRFETEKKNLKRFHQLSRIIRNLYKYDRIKPNIFNFLYLFFKKRQYQKKIFSFNEWLEVQGPYSKGLINFIKAKKDDYQAFIFFTYLYHPTNIGIAEVAAKSILIPTAHDEPQFYVRGYEKLFSSPRFIMYNTLSEKNLVERVYPKASRINSDIAGIGFDDDDFEVTNLPNYLSPKKYFIYIGRIVEDKGCIMMIEYFMDFKKNNPEYKDIKLVLVGKSSIDENLTKDNEDIILTGFLDDNLKNTLLVNAYALIMPSFYESLSLVTLEAMMMEIPVIVNKNCEVLYDHIKKSGSGKSFDGNREFSQSLLFYLNQNNDDAIAEGEKARNYVVKNYSWDVVINKYKSAVKSLK